MTIWYDFTTTLRATSRNGIANVEWSIGKALLEQDPSVRAFRMTDRKVLVESDPQTDLGAAVYAEPHSGSSQMVVAARTWRDDIRAGLLVALGARGVTVIQAASTVYQAPNRVRTSFADRGALTHRTPTQKLVDLVGPNDQVVSLGADWGGELGAQLFNLRRRTGCRVVTMVYDLIPITHAHLAFHNDPELFVRYYKQLAAASDLITCISEQSRQDLLDFGSNHRIAMPSTTVLRLGEDVLSPTGAAVDVEPGKFFLWVGTVERRKNLELLYDALRILESEGGDLPTIVVAGAFGWGQSDLARELSLQSTGASKSIIMLGAVDEGTLDALYRRAAALLFPSHYEGWGLPVREAAVRGCPVAAGDSPAVREAAAEYPGATLLSPDDPGPWADYLRNAPTRCEPVAIHSWSDSAKQLNTILATVVR